MRTKNYTVQNRNLMNHIWLCVNIIELTSIISTLKIQLEICNTWTLVTVVYWYALTIK